MSTDFLEDGKQVEELAGLRNQKTSAYGRRGQ
jgi:hypothetical protein